MKLEIYRETEEQAEEPVCLRLIENDAGDGLQVCAVDEDGDRIHRGALVTIKTDGSLYLHHSINEDLGFRLESDGRLIISQVP